MIGYMNYVVLIWASDSGCSHEKTLDTFAGVPQMKAKG